MAALLALLPLPAAAVEANVVTGGLDHPWSIAWLPDGRALVTELPGRLRILREGMLQPQPVRGVPKVLFAGQGGLFEALPHPRFADNHWIYLSYAHGTAGANATRIARARLEGGALSDLEVIFEVAPSKATTVHYGGRMAWLPDGTLLATTGDGFIYREQAQNLGSLLGKVIRITDAGGAPPDNPFVGQSGARPEVFTYGHRNPQGLVVDAENGHIWMHEHGARGGDEVNLLIAGANYGWPAVTRGIDYTGAYVTPYQSWPGMVDPVWHWTPSIAPSGMALNRGGAYPGWDGSLFVTALAARALYRLHLDGARVSGQEVLLAGLGERLRDVRVGPDGLLYVLVDGPNGRLLRIEPEAE